MDITWDVSKGQAPWTVTIAPIQHVPTTIQLPSDYLSSSSSWTYSWDVPSYSGSTNQLIVSVSDSTGSISGVSKVQSIDNSSSKCSTISESLDFVFFGPKAAPNQCEPWKITWQEDKGTNGLKYPVEVVILAENEQPISYSITDEKTKSIDWTVALKQGTDFTVTVYDAGKSGTGGVGGVYTVGNGKSGSQCLGKIGAGGTNNLLGASTTLQPTSTSKSKGGMATSRTKNPNGKATNDSSDSSKDSSLDDSSDSKHSSAGAAVGGVFAALAVIAIAVAGVWYYRRKKSQEDGLYGVKAGGATSRNHSNGEGGIGSILLAPFLAIGTWFSERSSGNNSPSVGYPRRQTNQFSTSFSGPNHHQNLNNNNQQDARNVGGFNGMMSERAGMSTSSLMRNGSQFPPNSPLTSPNGEIVRDPFSSNPNSLHGHGGGSQQQHHHSRGQSSSFGGVQPIGLGQDLHSRKSGSIHARSVYSIVPDEALFPPPAPRVVPDDALVPPIQPGSIRSGASSIKSGNSNHGHSVTSNHGHGGLNLPISSNLNPSSSPLTPTGTIPGTPIRGEGAGIGTWKAGEREREKERESERERERERERQKEKERQREIEREKIANRINNKPRSREEDPSSSSSSRNQVQKDGSPSSNRKEREFGHGAQDSYDTNVTRSTNTNHTTSSSKTVQPLGTDYIPPPVSTKSIFDPYSHMSQLYDAGIGREFWETDEDRRIMDDQVPEIPSEYRPNQNQKQEEKEEEEEREREESKAPRIPSLLGRAISPFLLPGETEDDDNQQPSKSSLSPNPNLPSLTAQSLSLNTHQQQQQQNPSFKRQHNNGSDSIDVKRNGDKILAGLQTELWNERRASRRPNSAISDVSSNGGGLPYL